VRSVRQYDHLAPATLLEGHWQINRNDISNHHAAILPESRTGSVPACPPSSCRCAGPWNSPLPVALVVE
jgi:hypothetical protein